MQIPADRLQRDLPDCRCNVIQKELVRRATQREQATIYSSDKLLRNLQRVRSNEWECGVRTDWARQRKSATGDTRDDASGGGGEVP
jgi:hypothetical protein